MSSSEFKSTENTTALPVTGEFRRDPEGRVCPVLDTGRIDFSKSVSGRKSATTLVKCAKGGEGTEQTFKDGKESFGYPAKPGDAIFVNSPTDIYVPGTKDGRLKFEDLEKNGYKIVSGTPEEGAQVKSPGAQLLVASVDARVCIEYAWGSEDKPENHQFLSVGATLKKDATGKVTGIDAEGFKKWEVDVVQAPKGNVLTA